jgi:hypothetical protein
MAKEQKKPFGNGREQGIVPKYTDIARAKAEEVNDDGYYSKLVENYPEHAEEIGHTSHIAKEYPNWRAI